MCLRRTRILSSTFKHWKTLWYPITSYSALLNSTNTIHFSTHVLSDTEPNSTPSFLYKVRIIAGNVRGASKTANIRLKLIGSQADSRSFLLAEDKGFSHASIKSQILQTDRELGTLRMVHVEYEKSNQEQQHASWFLERLIVEDSNGAEISFPCMQWFGKSDCGSIQAPLERHLLPASLNVGEMIKNVKESKVEVKASGMVIPHPQKVLQGIKAYSTRGRGVGGEDAFFYASGRNGVFGMGVADGVYAWREKGIDSGRFAFFLMDQAYINVKMGYDDVYQVLKTAARKVETEGVYGSSTCCLLTINLNQGRLNSANLGDSGFIVIGCRDYGVKHQLIFSTPQQEYEFGRPYQLGHHQYSSQYHEAMLYNFQIFPGDTIIMGTDGLFDNVFLPKIVEQVKICREGDLSPQYLVGKLISMAHELSLDRIVDTPYSNGFTEAFNLSSSGGKPDDITVIAAYVL